MNKKMIFMSLCLLLWGFSAVEGQKILAFERIVEVRYFSDTSVSGNAWEQMIRTELKQNPEIFPEAAAWNVEREVLVTGIDLPFTQKVLCLSVLGSKEQVLKQKLLSGNFGYQEDADGCVISSNTAQTLFGSLDVVGQKVKCRGKIWLIRGVVESGSPFIMISADRTEHVTFQALSLAYPDSSQTAKKTRELLFQYGISQEGVLLDGSFFSAVIRLCLTLPAWVILFVILWDRRVRRHPVIRTGLFLLGAAVLLRLGFHFPEDFIPGRWSDFGFWVRKYEEVRQNMLEILELEKTAWDARRNLAFGISAVLSVAAGMLIYTANNRQLG